MTPKFLMTRRAPVWLLSFMLAFAAVGLVQAQPVAAPAVPVAAGETPMAAASPAMAVPPMATPLLTPPASESLANPYGMRSVWQQGDLVARTTLLLLALMSLLSWYFIIAKLLAQGRLSAQAKAAKKAFAVADALNKRVEGLDKASPFRFIAESALEAARRYYSLAGQVDMNSWLSQDIVRSVATLQMRSQEGLSVLATIGSTAPFVGLFGTVWGIYNALVTIGVSGQASIEKVAGPVGEALIMTALGLAVAVPAVLGYNWLVRRNRVTLHAVKGFGSELHTLLLVEIDKSQRAGAASQAA
ncbi:MotA/TolQ/ExbB proton channel [Rhodoferax ferrireducens T118]|uniref:Biopolymer transport protein ExbB n=1 Tax=Albidiferax ferrireducens (strain ATCC BAA-621 / DSM 15236 / T118) TaxID=338969 RepID=Q21Y90_ALBFT|nr:MotA/TolQ/ExbB proton channel family protein [Rhodoferax ferrireducens]ABD69263.1 MotA/TolQ/ExbB proton channel [Rhodoferax ferrireducens T118]